MHSSSMSKFNFKNYSRPKELLQLFRFQIINRVYVCSVAATVEIKSEKMSRNDWGDTSVTWTVISGGTGQNVPADDRGGSAGWEEDLEREREIQRGGKMLGGRQSFTHCCRTQGCDEEKERLHVRPGKRGPKTERKKAAVIRRGTALVQACDVVSLWQFQSVKHKGKLGLRGVGRSRTTNLLVLYRDYVR